MNTMIIVVFGTPGPQGSKRFVGMSKKTGRGILIESSTKVKSWRQDVKFAALAVRNGSAPLDCPLRVSVVFTLPKPKSAPKTRQTWPMRTPDYDKLLRSTFDGLTEAGIWADDARVVEMGPSAKRYPNEGEHALDTPGAWILIEAVR